MSLSFLKDLFIVTGAEENPFLSYLPYLITALAAGVFLASLYFTLWKLIDARLSKRLYDAGATSAQDAKTLESLGYPVGTRRERALRFLLRSHSCILYKNISSSELDAQRLALMRQEGEVSTPAEDSVSGSAEATVEAADLENGEIVEAAPVATAPARSEKKKKLRPRTRMKVTPDTTFYLLPTRLEYVEAHALKFSVDELWSLGFTLAATVLFWLGALALLDPLVSLLIK